MRKKSLLRNVLRKVKPSTKKAKVNTDGEDTSTQKAAGKEFKWMALRCWVKCDLNGEPLDPLEVNGLARWCDLAERQGYAQSSLDSFVARSMAAKRAKADSWGRCNDEHQKQF